MLKKRFPKLITKSILTIAMAAFTFSVITKADGANSSAGTVEDPLVTKSYVDQQVRQLVADELAKQKPGTGTTAPTPPPITPVPGTPNSGSIATVVVELKPGETIYAGAGSEIIVRNGVTNAVSNDDNGIPDLTSGEDIRPNAAIKINHLLMFPREGRGVKADPKQKTACFVMVRGNYMVMNADGSRVAP